MNADLQKIKSLLEKQPSTVPPEQRGEDVEVQASIRYLLSDDARKSIAANPYWPKWDSPWWHMAALKEMGLADRIPHGVVRQLVEALQKQYPQDGSPATTSPCPCEIGNIFQILSAAGVSVDSELPWMRSWLLSRQMPDGGLSCDDEAYKVHPPASSIVGTIAPLEAVLLCTSGALSSADAKFVDAGAQCLIERKLMLGCSAPHNEEECLDEEDWLKLCFPRFYLYDVLRGLDFILHWSELRKKPIPATAIIAVVTILCNKSLDGQIRIERRSFEGVGSRVQTDQGKWERSKTASFFPLLIRVSEMVQVSPFLTARWTDAKKRIEKLIREELIE